MTDIVAILFAALYVLGAILNYLHIMSVMYLTGNMEHLSKFKLYKNSVFWPISVIGYLFDLAFTSQEDDE